MQVLWLSLLCGSDFTPQNQLQRPRKEAFANAKAMVTNMYIFLPYTLPMYKRIRKLLNTLAIDPLSPAYQYLEDILNITTSDRRHEYTTAAMLYDEVAKANGVPSASVRSAVRRAIIKAWSLADYEFEYTVFGNTVLFKRGRPTPNDFIANTTKYLLIKKS